MRYTNTKTGAILDSDFVITGEDWVAEEGKKPKAKKDDKE